MLCLFLGSVVCFLIVMRWLNRPEWRKRLADLQSRALLSMLLFALLAFLPVTVEGWHRIWEVDAPQLSFGKWIVPLLSLLATLGANREWQKEWLRNIEWPLMKVAVVVFLVSMALALLDLCRTDLWVATVVSLIVLIIGWIFLDPDKASLHFLYRDRLTEAFIVKKNRLIA